MNAVLLTTALLLGQPQAPPPPQAPPIHYGYEDAAKDAVATGKPLVTFLDVRARSIPGAVSCIAYDLPGYAGPAIVVSVPGGDWLTWRATLPATATDAQILAALAVRLQATVGQGGGLKAAPFAEPDAELPAEVSALLSGMERYTTARLTQVSGNRSGGGANWAVSRLSIPSKWQAPGGLDGLTGWSNRLYRLPRNPVKNWLGRVNDWENYGGGWGSEITYQREYGTGAKFADVLLTGRGVFEVRIAERVGGEWRRSIPYRDAKAEPTGYKRVSLQQCGECHNSAGDGAYGTARIIGGGGVLSEPLAGVE